MKCDSVRELCAPENKAVDALFSFFALNGHETTLGTQPAAGDREIVFLALISENFFMVLVCFALALKAPKATAYPPPAEPSAVPYSPRALQRMHH